MIITTLYDLAELLLLLGTTDEEALEVFLRILCRYAHCDGEYIYLSCPTPSQQFFNA